MNKSSSRSALEQTARALRREGEATRLTLASKHAIAFVNGNSQFNPRAFELLGTRGMLFFLKAVRSRGIAFSQPEPPKLSDIANAPTTQPQGWANQRRMEPHWRLRALTYGVLTGLMLTAVGSLGLFIQFHFFK